MTPERLAALCAQQKLGVISTRYMVAALIAKADAEAESPSFWDRVKSYVVTKQMERVH